MIIDGAEIAQEILSELQGRVIKLGRSPRLRIFVCSPNFETRKYLELKEKKATLVGMCTSITELTDTITTEDFIEAIQTAIPDSDSIIVQLPLPPHVDTDSVLASIPPSHDADVLNPHTKMLLSPVVGAIKKILMVHEYSVMEKFVTIIGSGRLVGLPAYHWFIEQGSHVSVVTRDTVHIEQYTKHADIVVCGAGVPGLLTPGMVKDGVVILDAGTSEDGGQLRGDADPACAHKALLFTPVPKGIGPITIAMLLANVVWCAEQKGTVI